MRWVAALLLALAFVPVAAAPGGDAEHAAREREAQQQLEQVRAQIKALTADLQATEGERGDAISAVKEKDLAINAVSRELAELDATRDRQQAELDKLEHQRDALKDTLVSQRAALAALLRSAYALGRNEELKLLLQQDDVAAIARVLAYHQYFQRARVDQIDGLLADLKDLAQVEDTIRVQTAELEQTRERREQERTRLDVERAERNALVGKLDTQLGAQRERIAALGKDQQALQRLLTELRDVFADIPRTLDKDVAFASQRGHLRWPLTGKLLEKFGHVDRSGRRSAGWLIAAKTGTPVHWFRGYGLLLILDHGDGWFSLYGCNEALLKDLGDWVDPGETIANSGASGDYKSAGVYFELRQRSEAINPVKWLASGG